LKCGGSEWIYKRRKRIREPNVAFKSQEDIKMLADNVTVFTSIIWILFIERFTQGAQMWRMRKIDGTWQSEKITFTF
jgi:hypothetical protein